MELRRRFEPSSQANAEAKNLHVQEMRRVQNADRGVLAYRAWDDRPTGSIYRQAVKGDRYAGFGSSEFWLIEDPHSMPLPILA